MIFVLRYKWLNSKTPFLAIAINVSGSNMFEFKSRYNQIGANSRQSVFIFGNADSIFVQGTLCIKNSGSCTWYGTEGLTASINEEGKVTVTLPRAAYDTFLLISAHSILSM